MIEIFMDLDLYNNKKADTFLSQDNKYVVLKYILPELYFDRVLTRIHLYNS